MDEQLIAAARAVKRRRRCRHPTLWLFTDRARLPDPLGAIARLPPGLSGVVLRDDAAPDRAALAAAVAKLCRRRRIALVVAGDARLAARLHAGLHLRRGRVVPGRKPGLVTASAHGRQELVRARRAGAGLVFLSPAFPTASHPGAPALGPVRWAALARLAGGVQVVALGGIEGRRMRALGPACRGVAAIGALSNQCHTVWR
ncbi:MULTISPECIES: thiamine phosphate synthase [Acidiphilium]|uniref:thiamine phosphate synthase n=1 Tax=Acidiphilium TaxID=522 RepID=UPI00054FDEAF|nr:MULTISPECIES: thiamine phosphate synthase [Acidiphilium]MBS3023773.1 thiamine phosphate synthase [Acidiphilium multivorum]